MISSECEVLTVTIPKVQRDPVRAGLGRFPPTEIHILRINLRTQVDDAGIHPAARVPSQRYIEYVTFCRIDMARLQVSRQEPSSTSTFLLAPRTRVYTTAISGGGPCIYLFMVVSRQNRANNP